ncbi:MAG: hypothetical protein ACI3VN_04530 [Candidatus Onthomonas sp.]
MSFWFLVDALFLLAGCYGLSLAVKVKMSGKLEDLRRVMPQYAHPNRCKDAQGFIRTIVPWLVMFSVATIISGFLGMLQDLELPVPQMLNTAGMILFLAAAVVFLKVERDAVGKYWGEEDQPDQVREREKKKKKGK